jgi:hypothetical protein
LEANTLIMGPWRFGNGRIGRERCEPVEPSLFAPESSSRSKEVEKFERLDSDRVDDESESLFTRPRLPEKDNLEDDELEIE